MSSLSYDPVAHIYRVNGVQKISITEMLGVMGYYGGAQFYTEGRRAYGTAVHKVAAAIDQHAPYCTEWEEAAGIFSALSPELVLDGRGWLLFKRETGFKAIQQWEQPMCSFGLQVAGTPDVVGMAEDRLTVVDVKTWKNGGMKPQRSAELQLAAYAFMVAEPQRIPAPSVQRWICRLAGNGKYRLYRCTNDADFAVIRSMACIYYDKLAAGLLKLSGEPEEGEIDDV